MEEVNILGSIALLLGVSRRLIGAPSKEWWMFFRLACFPAVND